MADYVPSPARRFELLKTQQPCGILKFPSVPAFPCLGELPRPLPLTP